MNHCSSAFPTVGYFYKANHSVSRRSFLGIGDRLVELQRTLHELAGARRPPRASSTPQRGSPRGAAANIKDYVYTMYRGDGGLKSWKRGTNRMQERRARTLFSSFA